MTLTVSGKTLDDFLRKLRTTGSIERTVMIDFKMCCLYVVLVLLGSVETQKSQSYNQKQSGIFYGSRCLCCDTRNFGCP